MGLERLLAYSNLTSPDHTFPHFCSIVAKDHIVKVNFKIGQKINIKDGFQTSQENERGII